MSISYPRSTVTINGGAYLGLISGIFLLIIVIYLKIQKEDDISKLGKGKKKIYVEIPEQQQIQQNTQTININMPSSSNIEEKNQNTKFCQMCGKPIKSNAVYCEFCGGEQ